MPKEQQNEPDQDPPKKPRKKAAPKKRAPRPPKGYNPDGIAKGLSALFFGGEDPLAKRKKKNKKAMCSNMEEYLSAYIVIGYDVDGEPMAITHANSQKDYDALSVALQKYVFSIAKPPFPPGDFLE